MFADVYFSIAVEPSSIEEIEMLVKSFGSFKKVETSTNRIVCYQTEKKSIQYTDLGDSVLEYSKLMPLPSLENVHGNFHAYLQILIDMESHSELKIYMGKTILSLLSCKGFGVDIHHK